MGHRTWQAWFLVGYLAVAAVVLTLALAQQVNTNREGDQTRDLVCQLAPESC
jgi:hypothetical protein